LIAFFCACKKQQRIISAKTNPDYEKADSFYSKGNDSAFYYYNKVVTGAADSLTIARAYNSMAIIQSDAGDYFGSQQSLLSSLSFLDESKADNINCLASNYNELGNTSLNLRNYDAAISYYGLAFKFIKNKDFKLTILNNQAVSYQKKKQYTEAIGIYNSIINESKGNKKQYARILSNLAKTEWLQDPRYNAAPDLLTALRMRDDEKDEWGLNASYAHLSDYYSAFQPELALQYANKMYQIAQQLSSPDDELEALQKLILLAPAKNEKQYFARYQYLNDSLQASRNAAKNQFALIRFDAEKNKTDNLRLQKENAEKKTQIIILFATLVALCTIAYIIIREIRNKGKRNQLRISKKVHDEVANGIYSIMQKVEHSHYMDDDPLLDDLDIVYEKSRNILYDHGLISHIDFPEEIRRLLSAFSSDHIKIIITGNERESWLNINENVKHEVKHVLQELMVNMKKHSAARNVVIKFEQKGHALHVQYADDGVGLQPGFKRGNGLTNTGNRINEMGGDLTFDTHTTKGLKIHILIPTS
jgi:signal transduction histidine kinase